VGKKILLHIVSVGLCRQICNARAPYYFAIRSLPRPKIIFPHYLIDGRFSKKIVTEPKMCVSIFSTTFVRNISQSRKNSERSDHNCTVIGLLHANCPNDIRVRFHKKFSSLDRYSESTQIHNPAKIRPEGAELFHEDEWTDGQT
jgi:hypothetical protein